MNIEAENVTTEALSTEIKQLTAQYRTEIARYLELYRANNPDKSYMDGFAAMLADAVTAAHARGYQLGHLEGFADGYHYEDDNPEEYDIADQNPIA